MPRKSKEINPFDGGLNNYANPRDLEENESVSLYNLSTLKKGELAPTKNWKITNLTGTTNYLNTKQCLNRYGLFVYQRDFTTADIPVDGNTTVYLVATKSLDDKSKLFLVNSLTQNAVATEVFEFNNTSGTVLILPCFVNADGNIRIGDGAFTTKTHFYGALKKYNFGGSAVNYNINEQNLISKPTSGTFYSGDLDTNTIAPEGSLSLNVKKVKSYSIDIFNHKSGSAYYDDINGYDANPNGIDSTNTSASFSLQQYGRRHSVQKRASDGAYSSTYLYPPDNLTGATSGSKMLVVSSYGNKASSKIDLEHDTGVLDNKFIFTDKSVYVRIWMSTTTFNALSSTAVKIRIGPRVDGDGSSFSNNYIFTFPSSAFANAETWTTLECAFGAHTEIEDNGGLNSNNCFELGIEVFDSSNFDQNWGFSYAIADITMGTPNEGQWVGKYNFYYNWIYDKTQHSETYKFDGQTAPLQTEGDILELMPYVKDSSIEGAFNRKVGTGSGITARITGANIFFSEVDDSGIDIDKDKGHLMEFDFDEGARTSLFDIFTSFGSVVYFNTGVLAAENKAPNGTNAVTLTVDTVTATDEIFAKKRIYKADGTLLGLCTEVNDGTHITFSEGLLSTVSNDDALYVVSNGIKLANTLSVKSPSVIDTFSTITGYSEGDKLESINFTTGAMLNRRMYLGNVEIYDQSSQAFKYSDRIYKSLPNQPDVFTKNGYVEVAPNDGESITAIATYGDFLLEYKENSMYLINVTQDVEYLEEKYIFAGVRAQSEVCETKNGIAWVNRYGLFLFNGKEVVNLLEEKIDRDSWYAETASISVIGYNPLENQIHVITGYSVTGFVYNFSSKGFERYSGLTITDAASDAINEDNWSNMITEPNGKLSILFEDSTETNLTRFEATPSGNVYIEMITKDDPLGDPAQFKSLKKCYLTYKINNAQVPAITYRTNGSTTDNAFDVAITNTSGVYTTLELKPNVRSESTNKHSYAIVIKGTSHSSIVINDINLVYREKSLK